MTIKFTEFLSKKHDLIYRIFIIIVTVTLIVYVFPKEGKFKFEYKKFKPWLHDDLIAPFDFAIGKSESELQQEKQEIIKNHKLYFRLNPRVYSYLKENYDQLLLQEAKNLGLNPQQHIYQQTQQTGLEIIEKIYAVGIIEQKEESTSTATDNTIYVLRGNLAEEREMKELHTIKTSFVLIKNTLAQHQAIYSELLLRFFENNLKQNITYDAAATAKVQKDAIENIALSREMKQKGERIISRGEIVNEDKFKILESLKAEYLFQTGGKTGYWSLLAGEWLLTGLAMLMMILFLVLYRADLFANSKTLMFMLAALMLNAFMASMAVRFSFENINVLPFCIVPLVIRSFFDTRVALFTHLCSMLIAGIIAPNPFDFMMIHLLAGFFAVYSIVDMHHRSQLFYTSGIIFLSYVTTYTAISLLHEGSFKQIDFTVIPWFAISAVLVLFVYPIIFIFEKLFGMVSELTLMELSDINAPLLRELALRAPGTFQHSMQVANLAEEAIIAIGGSSLLVRTGALYHDIGKMDMPVYFIENQSSGVNPHNELSFEDSAEIITGHVIKGIEIAKSHNLPDQIIDFIRTHHGTTKAQYFYQSFLKNFPEEEIDVSVFQYPGPIPFSKETAVLMMSDSVEAASRSLKHYDAESLDKLVDRVIDAQIAQNQFSNTDITFKNIAVIKKIFKKNLSNIYHIRIEYPQ